MMAFLLPTFDLPSEHGMYKPVPAIHGRAAPPEEVRLPAFGDAGTGGIADNHFYLCRQGYQYFCLIQPEEAKTVLPYAPFADLMKDIKAGFGRTMNCLPGVFNVSRQTLYNWTEGETPKEKHHDKLQQLAAAARVFSEVNLKPTPLMLDRTVYQGKSLLQLIADGADGNEMARKLVRIVRRGHESRQKLDELLGGRKASNLNVSDIGTPSFDEDA